MTGGHTHPTVFTKLNTFDIFPWSAATVLYKGSFTSQDTFLLLALFGPLPHPLTSFVLRSLFSVFTGLLHILQTISLCLVCLLPLLWQARGLQLCTHKYEGNDTERT